MNTKHTQEYAEQIAINILRPKWEHCFIGDKLVQQPYTFLLEKRNIIEGYMKAVEETAAPELLEALIIANNALKATYPLFHEWPEAQVIAAAIKKAQGE